MKYGDSTIGIGLNYNLIKEKKGIRITRGADFMMHGRYGMFGGNGIGGIVGIILIIILAYLIINYFNKNKNNSDTFNRKGNAIEILNERYAKGEIDEEEYNRRKKFLKE